jgi:hypothetical protein
MVQGFDFGLSASGELALNQSTWDIQAKMDDDLRLQLAYDRIKSVSTNWFIDEIGANLESLIGKPCNETTAEAGKALIMQQLTSDLLWEPEEIFIKATIVDMINITYNIYFKIKDASTEDTYSYELIAEIDMVKGVNIRYGWEPKYDRIKYKNI